MQDHLLANVSSLLYEKCTWSPLLSMIPANESTPCAEVPGACPANDYALASSLPPGDELLYPEPLSLSTIPLHESTS